jgi:hypothetical protein
VLFLHALLLPVNLYRLAQLRRASRAKFTRGARCSPFVRQGASDWTAIAHGREEVVEIGDDGGRPLFYWGYVPITGRDGVTARA